MTNVLMVTPFPFSQPIHGGQLRMKAIFNYFKGKNCHIQSVGVRTYNVYPEERGYLPSPGSAVLKVFSGDAEFYTYGVGQLFFKDSYYFNKLKEQITITPDIIVIEHPWLFDFVDKYVNTLDSKPLLIYDAHNIEWKLKKSILSARNPYFFYEEINEIKQLELRVIENVDLILAVSESDKQWLESNTIKKVITVKNGIDEWQCAENFQSFNDQYCLFIGSSHEPNLQGFNYYLGGKGFGALNYNQKLIVAGGISDRIERSEIFLNTPGLRSHSVTMGVVSDSELARLKNYAHAFLLPLVSGGGTNLKTAEAILSGRYVIASKFALRGFEEFSNEKGIYICESPEEFKRSLRLVMNLPDLELTVVEKEFRRNVLWSRQFNELDKFLNWKC